MGPEPGDLTARASPGPSREGVVAVPQRAVLSEDSTRSVRLVVDEPDPKDPDKTVQTMKEGPVKVGIRGIDGNVEILSGVKEGDKVVTGVKNQ